MSPLLSKEEQESRDKRVKWLRTVVERRLGPLMTCDLGDCFAMAPGGRSMQRVWCRKPGDRTSSRVLIEIEGDQAITVWVPAPLKKS